MLRSSQDSYDAVIIGAGIGGLVCGCYLAKAGMKVLIAEQHYKPGGYCTSFKRKGFTFDAAADCFGGYRNNGVTRLVLRDLEIDKGLQIIRFDPSDTVITPDYAITYWNDLERTINELQAAFPKERDSLRDFFSFVINPDPNSFSKIRSWTFKTILDRYFIDERLKSILSFPLLAIGGLPPSMMSAFISVKLFSEFFLDGGYYTKGGIQALPDALAARFTEFGGDLRLSCLVKKIKVKDSVVKGIVTEGNEFIPSRYVISGCDARQTFLKLLGKKKITAEFHNNLLHMIPTISNLIVYLGVDEHFQSSLNPGTALFFSPHYDLEKAYQAAQAGNIEAYGGYALRLSYDKSTLKAIVPLSYKTKIYWKKNKNNYLNKLLERIEMYSIPRLSKHIAYKEAASPHTLYRYTLNYKGASYGWAGTSSQLAIPDLSKPSFIKGLYLTGHWTTLGTGISGVVYVGYDTARIILRKEKFQYNIKIS